LYFLYETQTSKPKTKINITIELFEQVLQLREHAYTRQIYELYAVLNKLNQLDAFSYVAHVRIDPIISNFAPPTEEPTMEATPLPLHLLHANTLKDVLDIQKLKQLTSAYNSIKESILKDPTITSTSSSENMKTSLTRTKQKIVLELSDDANMHENTNEARMIQYRTEWRKEVQKENTRLARLQAKAKKALEEKDDMTNAEDDGGDWGLSNIIRVIENRVTGSVNNEDTEMSNTEDVQDESTTLQAPPIQLTQLIQVPSGNVMTNLVKKRRKHDFIDDFILDAQVPVTREEIESVEITEVTAEDIASHIDMQGNVITPKQKRRIRKNQSTDASEDVASNTPKRASKKKSNKKNNVTEN
jgi:hypothetical protein